MSELVWAVVKVESCCYHFSAVKIFDDYDKAETYMNERKKELEEQGYHEWIEEHDVE